MQGIGLRLLDDAADWRQFVSRGEAERQSFVGQLNFGLLQPDEVFSLNDDASAWIDSDIRYAGDARSELVDPFSLGGAPPLQIQLQGLDLLVAAVPEPSNGLALVAGLVLLGAVQHRQQRTVCATRNDKRVLDELLRLDGGDRDHDTIDVIQPRQAPGPSAPRTSLPSSDCRASAS